MERGQGYKVRQGELRNGRRLLFDEIYLAWTISVQSIHSFWGMGQLGSIRGPRLTMR